MEDNQIIELFWQRDESAITETGRKYGAYCRTIANNILQNNEDAEECVNDTWLKAWNSIPPARPASLKAYLGKITRNLALDKAAAASAQKRGGGEYTLALDELAECIADGSDIEQAYEEKELKEYIFKFLRTLPERERNLFVRRYFFVDTVKEIAAKYALTENNVMVILSRTRKQLKSKLMKEGFIDE